MGVSLARSRALLSFIVCLGVTAPALPARAADPVVASPEAMKEARGHYAAGKTAQQSGDFALARREFEQAYTLLPLPEFLRSLSVTTEKQGQLDDAIRYGEQYLKAEPGAADASEVNARLAELREKQKQAALARAAAAPPPAAVASSGPSLAPPLALLGGGVALLAIGGGLGLAARSAANIISDPGNDGQLFTQGHLDLYNRGQAYNAAAISLGVIGGAVLIGGAVWTGLVVNKRRHSAPNSSVTKEAP